MLTLGAVICELLGDPKWTDRLQNRGKEYGIAAKTLDLDQDTRDKLDNMSNRAKSLGQLNDLNTPGKNGLVSRNLISDIKSSIRKRTDSLYPNRVKVRQENIAKEATKKEANYQKEKIENINRAKAMLPKSLQK